MRMKLITDEEEALVLSRASKVLKNHYVEKYATRSEKNKYNHKDLSLSFLATSIFSFCFSYYYFRRMSASALSILWQSLFWGTNAA